MATPKRSASAPRMSTRRFVSSGSGGGGSKLRRPSRFFFKWYGHHRDLHSFPTRRSSDLPEDPVEDPRQRIADDQPEEDRDPPRSEEHTSELESRENIVCRLLLEKKNGHRSASAASPSWPIASQRGTRQVWR